MRKLIEIWSAKPGFEALAPEERQLIVDKVLSAVAPVMEKGLTLEAAGMASLNSAGEGTPRYFAVWTSPNDDMMRHFLAALSSAGWFEYFEQTDAGGETVELQAILQRHIVEGR